MLLSYMINHTGISADGWRRHFVNWF